MIIALTGPIAAGKTQVTTFFKDLGAMVINADLIGHDLIEPYTVAYKKIVAFFGEEILSKDGKINRLKLGELVFADLDALKNLNNILHPLILAEVQRRIQILREEDPEGLILIEAAVLFEMKLESLVDKVIVVSATLENRLERLLARGLNQRQALNRIESQRPLSEYLEKAALVIENNGTLQELKAKVKEISESL